MRKLSFLLVLILTTAISSFSLGAEPQEKQSTRITKQQSLQQLKDQKKKEFQQFKQQLMDSRKKELQEFKDKLQAEIPQDQERLKHQLEQKKTALKEEESTESGPEATDGTE